MSSMFSWVAVSLLTVVSTATGSMSSMFSWVAVSLLTVVSTATGIPQDGECKDYGVDFERVFTRPGEAAMMNCSLVDPRVFNLTHPYNITWYHLRTGLERSSHMGHTIIQGTTLWFFNTTEEDEGEFMCVVRTLQGCFKQRYVLDVAAATWLERGCVHKERSRQFIVALTDDVVSCHSPVIDYLSYLDTYSIHWYRGCEVLQMGGKFLLRRDGYLHVTDVVPGDADNYTCLVSFQLGGVEGRMTETIETTVSVEVTYQPQILLPEGEISKVDLGSAVSKVCRVLVPGVGTHTVLVIWRTPDTYISENTTHRIHQLPQRELPDEDGVIVEVELVLSEVREEDLNVNFTCEAHNDRKIPMASFRLQLDSNLLLPLGLVFGGVALAFVQCVVLYRLFKIEIALTCRAMMPYLYRSTEGDGKLYDAYVVYPRVIGQSGSAEETFALSTIPKMLEGRYGYRLFILGRDCMPGEALVDVVCSSLALSRRVLLMYGGRSLSCEGVADWGAWLEQQLALQRSLLEDEGLGVVLIDLGGVSDSALPPALRLLKEEQGALSPAPPHACCSSSSSSSSSSTHGCCGTEEEEEEEEEGEGDGVLPFINPPPRFWRELRYHMPIRGKARPRTRKHKHTHTQTHTHTAPV